MDLTELEDKLDEIKSVFDIENVRVRSDCCMSCYHSYSRAGTLDCHCKILEQKLREADEEAPEDMITHYSKINPTMICDLYNIEPLD